MFSTFFLSLLIGLATPAATPVAAEELYHVLFIQGQILNKTTGALLQRGDKIKATDKVVFKSSDGKAIVLSNTRGRFVMAANPSKVNSELGDVVSGIVSPLKTNSKLSTRGGEEEAISDLEAHFGITENGVTPTFIIVGDIYNFKVSKNGKNANTLAEGEGLALFFKAQDRKGTKRLGVKIEGNIAKFALNKASLSTNIDINKLEIVEFHKWNEATKKANDKVLASFRPVFVDSKDLKASFSDYLAVTNVEDALNQYIGKDQEELSKVAKMGEKEKKAELLAYFVSEFYGKTTETGEVNLKTVKVDTKHLLQWITENNL